MQKDKKWHKNVIPSEVVNMSYTIIQKFWVIKILFKKKLILLSNIYNVIKYLLQRKAGLLNFLS